MREEALDNLNKDFADTMGLWVFVARRTIVTPGEPDFPTDMEGKKKLWDEFVQAEEEWYKKKMRAVTSLRYLLGEDVKMIEDVVKDLEEISEYIYEHFASIYMKDGSIVIPNDRYQVANKCAEVGDKLEKLLHIVNIECKKWRPLG